MTTTVLSCRVALYVPVVYPNFGPANKTVCEEFALWFGGFTAVNAAGGWVNSKGKIVRDQIRIVFAYCTPEQLAEREAELRDLAVRTGRTLEQATIALEINNALEIIPCR